MRAYEDCYRDTELNKALIGASFQSYPLKNTDEAPIEDAL
jgi:hypothetical protein